MICLMNIEWKCDLSVIESRVACEIIKERIEELFLEGFDNDAFVSYESGQINSSFQVVEFVFPNSRSAHYAYSVMSSLFLLGYVEGVGYFECFPAVTSVILMNDRHILLDISRYSFDYFKNNSFLSSDIIEKYSCSFIKDVRSDGKRNVSVLMDFSSCFPFSKDEIKKISSSVSGVYFLGKSSKDGDVSVKYVGSSWSLKERLLSHFSNRSLRKECDYFQYLTIESVHDPLCVWERNDYRQVMLACEYYWIYRLQPVLNKRVSAVDYGGGKYVFHFKVN